MTNKALMTAALMLAASGGGSIPMPRITSRGQGWKPTGSYIKPRTEPKLGRNSICPCGCGLKVKKCLQQNNKQ